jgi:hypothetical protein
MASGSTRDLVGCQVVNHRDQKIGKVDRLVRHGDGDDATWAVVKLGLIGLRKVVVPLETSAMHGERCLCLPYETEVIREAPKVALDDDRLSDEDADKLARHFGLEPVASPSGIDDEEALDLPRETRDAKPPAMEEAPDSPLNERRRERLKELEVPGYRDGDDPEDREPERAEPRGETEAAQQPGE